MAGKDTILVVGCGALLNDVVRALVAQSADRRVVAVSTSPAAGDRGIDPSSPACARRLCDLLLELRPDALVLLALSQSPVTPAAPWAADAALAEVVTSALGRFVELGGDAPSLLFLSSTAVYGVAPGSPLVFDERSALPRETVFSSDYARWAQGLRDVERRLVVWAVTAGVNVGVLRTASVLGGPPLRAGLGGPAAPAGPAGHVGHVGHVGMDSPLAALLRSAFPVRVLGFDPPCQVIHYDDLVDAIVLAVDQRCGEVLNIVGRSVVPLSRLFAMAGVVAAPLPGPIADRLVSASSDGARLRWRTLADGRRATTLLGFRAQRTLEDCLRASS